MLDLFLLLNCFILRHAYLHICWFFFAEWRLKRIFFSVSLLIEGRSVLFSGFGRECYSLIWLVFNLYAFFGRDVVPFLFSEGLVLFWCCCVQRSVVIGLSLSRYLVLSRRESYTLRFLIFRSTRLPSSSFRLFLYLRRRRILRPFHEIGRSLVILCSFILITRIHSFLRR